MVYPPTRWFIGFVDGEIPWPWGYFCRPGFRHVFAMYYVTEKDVWQFIEWSSYRLYIEILDGEQVDAVFAALAKQGTLLDVEVKYWPDRIAHPTVPIYCVSWVKQLIGLRKTVVTPYGLYCALLKRGATVIFGGEGDQHAKSFRFQTKKAG